MGIIVQKYGGSSVADPEKIQAVARKVVETHRAGHSVVVAISAMGNTTDDLLALSRRINPSPSRRELDMLLTVGERISMALLSMAIHSHGVDAISFTGSQSGILTTASHSNARIVEVRPYRIQDELEQGRVVIVAGYQGVSYRREITTLGRGGTDTTAVALAAALGAEACEIYSDVDGVFSSDPRVVQDAQRLEEMSYEEMQELARLGAKVLNATAVEFARRAGIALYARSTHQKGSVGTHIHGGGALRRVDGLHERAAEMEKGPRARAISGLKEGLWLQGQGSAQAAQAVLERVAAVDSPLCDVEDQGEEVSLRLLLNLDDVHDVEALEGDLRRLGEGWLELGRRGLVGAVGLGLGDRPGALLKARAALRAAGIPVGCARASGVSLRAIVPTEHVPEAMRLWHAALVELEPQSAP